MDKLKYVTYNNSFTIVPSRVHGFYMINSSFFISLCPAKNKKSGQSHENGPMITWCVAAKYCSAIGVITTQRPEYTILAQELKARCNPLWPLLDCDGLDTVSCGVKKLGKQSIQHLSI